LLVDLPARCFDEKLSAWRRFLPELNMLNMERWGRGTPWAEERVMGGRWGGSIYSSDTGKGNRWVTTTTQRNDSS
jgi:hypothetical protein